MPVLELPEQYRGHRNALELRRYLASHVYDGGKLRRQITDAGGTQVDWFDGDFETGVNDLLWSFSPIGWQR